MYFGRENTSKKQIKKHVFPLALGIKHASNAWQPQTAATTMTADTEPQSPATELVRTGSMSLDLYDAFHDWRDLPTAAASPVNGGPPSQVFYLDPIRKIILQASPPPPPMRFVHSRFGRPPISFVRKSHGQFPHPQEEENVLNGCGLSQTDSSDTEILQGSDLQPVDVGGTFDSDDQLEDGELSPEPAALLTGGKRKQPELAH